MKTGITLLVVTLFATSIFAQNNNALLDSANSAYAKNNFSGAIGYYEKVLASGYESAGVYYNIGNAHYKNKNLPLAILNYEKAKKLAPADEDILYNLKLVNEKLVDKIEVIPSLFLKDWWSSFLQLLPEKSWSIICLVLFWLGISGLVIYFVSKSRLAKQAGFSAGVLLLFLSFLFYFVAQKSFTRNNSHTEGIVFSLSVNIKGSPSEQGTDLFILHEGTKVGIEQMNDDWTEIRLPNGNRGWLKSKEVGII